MWDIKVFQRETWYVQYILNRCSALAAAVPSASSTTTSAAVAIPPARQEPGKARGRIDKPKSPYTSCCVQASYVKHHFYTQFNRGMVLELFGAHLFGPDLDDEKTSSQRGGNG